MFIKTTGSAFWAGFAAVGLTWLAFALLKTLPNDNVLASKIAVVFQLPNWIFVLLITVVIGGLVGGLSCLSGSLLKKVFAKK
ncbi:MAG: hypothetical protein EOO03_16405 [Chitinophagaceae bacterium]|nr:MAG: hypothetical protein EOO03_16405 [Chitinophagaceae bacterium]